MLEFGPQPETKSADVESQGEQNGFDLSKETFGPNPDLAEAGRYENRPEENMVDSNPLQQLTESGG